jgi:allantoinase
MRECRFPYTPIIGRPHLKMPNDERIAVWIGLNIEYQDFNEPVLTVRFDMSPPPSPHGYGWFQYGLRVGVFRIMDILDDHGMRASVPLYSEICNSYPAIIEEGNNRDWVWLAHGTRGRVNPHDFDDPDEERAFLTQIVEDITNGTGKAPNGWLGPALVESYNTPDLLAELGISYVCDWVADDQPFALKVESGRMINVPYAVDGLNDMRLLGTMFTGEDYSRIIIDQFDQLYEDGTTNPRVMGIPIHPFITGQPYRAKHFRRAIEHIASHEDVWLTTSDEIADWYYASAYQAPE